MTDQSAITIDTRLAVNPTLVLRVESDDCALLFDPDSGRVHVLNPTAVAVWKRLDGRRTLREIVATLGEEFDEMGVESGDQVVALARSLAGLGTIGLPVEQP
jgi:hypothetical protein